MSLDASWADKTSNTGRDPSAFVVGGFSAEGDFYIIQIVNKRISPDDVINILFELVETHGIQYVASEDIGTQKGINKLIDDEMIKRKVYFDLNRVKHQAQTKGSRIMGLQPMFQNGHIVLPEHGMEEFKEQYMSFSPAAKITHDDILDALEMVVSEYREVFVQPETTDQQFVRETYSVYDTVTGRAGWLL